MRVPFRERNPVPIGLISFAVLAVLLLAAANVDRLPLIGGGEYYTARFSEAAGLRVDEEVRVAGVRVGKVTDMELAGDHVKVTFRIEEEGVRLGELTRAEIKIKSMLGSHYVALVPRGGGRLRGEIPLERTSVPYNVVPALNDLSKQVGQIDHAEVARSFQVLADTFENSPEEIRASLKGLRRLSETISSRDAQLHELADRARSVSQLLADRNADFARLIEDGDRLLQAVRARREVIHQLLVRTVLLSQQVNALIAENEAELKPMLANLERVSDILLRNQKNLDRMLELYGPFTRQFTDATGSGRWFDNYLQNILPIPVSVKDAQGSGGSGGGQAGTPRPSKDNPLPFLP
ncbi:MULTISPECIES: MCE family protein [Thermomonospora]|mgnify:CR=1 FL=1|uniref:Virulence factor Mce family protein n=1 Tax=Thermomonospora curvata (strain ATCC 19995 / DSM 43183 / JCM 3096 / KCTC 9072 / NBRC 15933 / NCIMB 10081 / Henssen B9) TaxID=471852 RepID=D1A3A1_THECD|nr:MULTISPECIES: MCE family protein [Thermomonospora]ACY99871.1 virulence factor Mce family protein [Thermomonospora curvata DSM 43183]PKK12874.1 MAG: ABC transporter substrate-binding protein [Thermomonospora sp. CIF 1]